MLQTLQYLTLLDPLRYFLIIVHGLFLEDNLYAILFNQYWPMAIIAALSLSFAS